MGFSVSILITEEWNGALDEAAQSLMTVAQLLDNVELPILASRRIAMEDMDKRFQTETDPDGTPWIPLTEDYLEQKQKDGYPDDILTRTGEMAAAADEAFIVTENALIFDSSAMPFYAMIHQDGSDPYGVAGTRTEQGTFVPSASEDVAGGVGKGNALPQRKWIGLSEEAEAEIAYVFDLWFDEATSIAIQPEGALFPGLVQQRTPSGQFGPRI